MAKPVKINGYKLYPFINRQALLDFLNDENWQNILVALNAEKLIREDVELKKLVNHNLGYPDGIGAVWALRRKGRKSVKIPGAEFWLDIINSFQVDKTFYLIGGEEEVIEATVEKLKDQFPHIKIVGYNNGYFNETGFFVIKDEILKKKPDVVFVAMGSPRQEFIMQELESYHKALYMGLGGSFDVYIGKVARAPKMWIDLNLEWAYRLFKQPKRIFRQWVLFKFIYRLITNKL
ncbi:WecB/TagA/CpsF family glycosyltransferase [Gracilimonas sediminicola]|uniref:WecB/TagA/CpsF family glycosyltransferase n=1 Tax=Gracilimonas sediminicola TaxID=2952158 RepID=UPI0038D3BB8C